MTFICKGAPFAIALAVFGAPSTKAAVTAEGTYTFDILSNVSGGLDTGVAYLDNIDATVEVDADALWGWKGTTFFLYGLYNNGEQFSENKVGDAQIASNIETGVSATRLYEAWVNQEFWNGRASARLGLYDLNSEFDVLESASLYTNSAFGIGTDFGLAGENGPSIFPSTSFGLRLEGALSDQLKLRVAILDGVPGDPAQPDRTTVRLGSDDGALVAMEVEASANKRKLLVGGWTFTRETETFDTPITEQDTARENNYGFYIRGEQALTGETLDYEDGLYGFFRLGTVNGDVNQFGAFASAGLTAYGPLAHRPSDSTGVAFAWAKNSDAFSDFADREGEDASHGELAIEATYSFHVNDLISVQPTMQYIVTPGGDRSIDDAFILGVRTSIGSSLEFFR